MMNPNTPPTDCSKVQSNHQLGEPKWEDKHSHLKRMRSLSRKEIQQQLSEPPEPDYERRQ